jgi:hypothetical protein
MSRLIISEFYIRKDKVSSQSLTLSLFSAGRGEGEGQRVVDESRIPGRGKDRHRLRHTTGEKFIQVAGRLRDVSRRERD